VAEFRTANQSLVLLAQRDLRDFWRSLNLSGDPAEVRAAVLAFFPELVTAYGDASALLGADFYDSLRNVPPSAARFRATLAGSAPAEQAEGSVRWALGSLFAEQPDQALMNLSGSAQRLVLQAGRDTIARSAFTDPVRTGFARVPQGDTCKFCVMVASRGAIYKDASAAGEGNRYHDDCNCVPTPVRSPDDLPEGYDVHEMRRLYEQGAGIGRDLPPD
jgi:hypothetical protein